MRDGVRLFVGSVFAVAAVAGCGDSTSTGGNDSGVTPDVAADSPAEQDASASDPQLPPTTGRVAVRAWLAAGHYRSWRCEAMPHAQRLSSPHGSNRICANATLAGAAAAPWPVGSAAVKELYNAAGTRVGYAVYVKARAGTDGANWYWFEEVAPGTVLMTPDPVEADGTVADGFGDRGNPRAVCVGCHASGMDYAFTPRP